MPAGWRVVAHVGADAPLPGWRDDLARRLGQRPRRIGPWAELALHGALQCLDVAGEPALPAAARLRVASLGGAATAMRAAAQQLRHGAPLPFTFMQSQPSLMLAALGAQLAWQGDAVFLSGRDPAALLQLALRGAAPAGVLFGWVEEGADDATRSSAWWRLRPR